VAVCRRLPAAAHLPAVAEVLARLLLDEADTAVCQEAADALLRRRDVHGLRLVLAGLAAAQVPWCPEPTIADRLYGAVAGGAWWMSDQGQLEFLDQLEQLLQDPNESVRRQARELLSERRDAAQVQDRA
jgi:HEAT repeat protein